MNITEIIWLPQTVDKLAEKHEVQPYEVEELLFGNAHIRFVERGFRAGEDLYAATGQTESGRYLIVYFIVKAGNRALIISARSMERKERRTYGRRK